MENIEAFDEQTTTYCETILKETKKKRQESLQFLRNWLDENKEYNVPRDDYTLVRYLRASKYNHDRALSKLECMYKLRTNSPEWFKNRDPLLPEIRELMELGVFLPLLKRDPEGKAVILIRATAHDPYYHLQNNVFKTGMMLLDLFLNRNQDTSVHGVVAILDLKNVTLGHARQMTIPIIKKCVHSWQDCYPVRVGGLNFFNSPAGINVILNSIKQFLLPKLKRRACYPVRIRSINFFNSPVYVNVVLNVFKQFMTPKLKLRVHVHGYDQKSLEKNVPLDILPSEYGGSGESVKYLTEYWTREAIEARDWFKEDEEFKFIASEEK